MTAPSPTGTPAPHLHLAPAPDSAPFQVTDKDAVRAFIDALECEFPQKSREEIEAAYLDACSGPHQGESAPQIREHILNALDTGADRIAPIV